MHPKDTPKGGNLTPTPTPSRNLLSPWGSNHVSVTSGLDTLGADFLILNNSVTVEEKLARPPVLVVREAGFSYFYPALGHLATSADRLPRPTRYRRKAPSTRLCSSRLSSSREARRRAGSPAVASRATSIRSN